MADEPFAETSCASLLPGAPDTMNHAYAAGKMGGQRGATRSRSNDEDGGREEAA